MVWSRCYHNEDQRVVADARTWALPWVSGQVVVALVTSAGSSDHAWREAETGEQGSLLVERPYPYLALTVW